jgi:hypothetical protein
MDKYFNSFEMIQEGMKFGKKNYFRLEYPGKETQQ